METTVKENMVNMIFHAIPVKAQLKSSMLEQIIYKINLYKKINK